MYVKKMGSETNKKEFKEKLVMIALIKFILFLFIIMVSKRYIKGNLNRIDRTSYLFFNICFVLLLYKFVSLNTNWYKVKDNILLVIASDIDRILLLPYITLILLVVIKKINLIYKIVVCGAWLLIVPALEHINEWTGIVTFENWRFSYSLLESTVLLIGNLLFLYGYHSLKEEKHYVK
ncbi:hypothetical protein BSG1_04460 [Bacillus sp. SG-1]|nr:hypothetical protein BSG1_04460 [Bacillus sp. SG-1]